MCLSFSLPRSSQSPHFTAYIQESVVSVSIDWSGGKNTR